MPCKHENCNITSNYEGIKQGIFCNAHKKINMVDVVNNN